MFLLSTRFSLLPVHQQRALLNGSRFYTLSRNIYTPRIPQRNLNFPNHQHLNRSPRLSTRRFSTTPTRQSTEKEEPVEKKGGVKLDISRENIYTLPNALTLSRILSCPLLGYSILDGNFTLATGILAYAGISDWFDGFLARRFQMRSVLGTILDPAADKALMTTLTVTLALKDMIPIPLAIIILGRDVLLVLTAFYVRYKSLPSPKTFRRYWDLSIPSAEVHPTTISKVNTALQLLLMGVTTVSPLLSFQMDLVLQTLQWTVAGTTIWSGFSYVFSSSAVRIIASKTNNIANTKGGK
ncbi:phosphatidyl synthase [Pyrrhoderma noxium]|uniref:Phosphatidyl synthase n=1 Tax=Pyrrhoderma noxium TaxID=2282107 RepID=A0A286UJC2_9AGAM|nr:phosphatidyl synthase [Pyrrhoderma noxium]